MGLQLVGIPLLNVETFGSKRGGVLKAIFTIETKRNPSDSKRVKPP
jgi:hypothetical protein